MWKHLVLDEAIKNKVVERMFFKTPVANLDLCTSKEKYQAIFVKSAVETFDLEASQISQQYSFVILDTDPLINPFRAIDQFFTPILHSAHVLIPVFSNPMALTGVELTLDYLHQAQDTFRDIRLLGAFLTSYSLERETCAITKDKLNKMLPTNVFETIVRRRDELLDIYFNGPLQLTAPCSMGAVEYAALADEIILSIKQAEMVAG